MKKRQNETLKPFNIGKKLEFYPEQKFHEKNYKLLFI